MLGWGSVVKFFWESTWLILPYHYIEKYVFEEIWRNFFLMSHSCFPVDWSEVWFVRDHTQRHKIKHQESLNKSLRFRNYYTRQNKIIHFELILNYKLFMWNLRYLWMPELSFHKNKKKTVRLLCFLWRIKVSYFQ